VVLLRKSFPQKTNLHTAAELGVIKGGAVKQIFVLILLISTPANELLAHQHEANELQETNCKSSAAGVVFCGSRATYCQTSDNGNVSCGGLAAYCEASETGKVACGGNSDTCLISATGEVACGDLAQYCETSETGKVACGKNAKQ
jgi:hypothetical protein